MSFHAHVVLGNLIGFQMFIGYQTCSREQTGQPTSVILHMVRPDKLPCWHFFSPGVGQRRTKESDGYRYSLYFVRVIYISTDLIAGRACLRPLRKEVGKEREEECRGYEQSTGLIQVVTAYFVPAVELAAMNPRAYMGARVCGGASGATSQLTVI